VSFDLKLVGGSFRIGASGDLETVTGLSKLSQDSVKILVTPTGSHRAIPWYGSSLSARATGAALLPDFLESEVTTAVVQALQNLQTLQQQQEQTGQYLLPDEAINRIVDVSVGTQPGEPRQINVIVSIRTRSGQVLTERIGVQV
jgi:hypothetical protein